VITVQERGPVAVLQIDHGKVNALDLELLTALTSTMADLADAPAVVVTGVRSVFSAGVDLRRIVDGGQAYVREFIPALDRAFLAVFDHPGPLVAAVNGHAIAGGCVLAAACDLRLMSAGTIGLTELQVGVPFPTVALEIMRHAAGAAVTSIVLPAMPLSVAEAYRLGLLDGVPAPEDLLVEAVARAEAMARIPAGVFAHTKRQLHAPARQRIDELRAADADVRVAELWQSPATRAAVAAYLDQLAGRTGR
jgi:enoyl-CoA hydratase